jgi:toxin ParE1/3/4
MPDLGRARSFMRPGLSGLRSFRVAGFRNYLVFYRTSPCGIDIVRVLHGARDLDTLFADD